MSIPIFEDFLYPFLNFISEKDMTSSEMRQAMIAHFGLTDEDCNLKTKGGNTTQLGDRLNWVRQYLRRAQFIELPSRGLYRITDRGRNYLATHSDLRKKDLMDYPEFAEYAIGTTTNVLPAQSEKDSKESNPLVTPTEQLESAYSAINKDLATELLQTIKDQSPKFFERLVLDLLKAMGYGTSSYVTSYSHDDGIDGIIYEDKLGLGRIYVQAKRYNAGNLVGKPEVQRFSGALDEKSSQKGIFITTSDYTSGAREYAKTHPNKSIVLINGEELAQYMIEFNVGVSLKKAYDIKRIDLDYFKE
jgi:restriction system protein